jgi:hypothetical protein
VNLVEHDENFRKADPEEVDFMCIRGGELIDEFRDKKKSFHEAVTELYLYLNNCIQKKNGRINDDYARLQIAFAMTHGLSLHLFHDNYISCMNDVMNELFHYDIFDSRVL